MSVLEGFSAYRTGAQVGLRCPSCKWRKVFAPAVLLSELQFAAAQHHVAEHKPVPVTWCNSTPRGSDWPVCAFEIGHAGEHESADFRWSDEDTIPKHKSLFPAVNPPLLGDFFHDALFEIENPATDAANG